MNYVIRNDQYSHGKKPGFIIADPEFVQIGD